MVLASTDGTALQYALLESPKPACGETVPADDRRFLQGLANSQYVLREDREAKTCFHYERVDGEVAADVKVLKTEWKGAGCTIPYMGFNLIPLSVIPEIRITDKGLVLVPQMTNVPLFEPWNGR